MVFDARQVSPLRGGAGQGGRFRLLIYLPIRSELEMTHKLLASIASAAISG